ncbi:MAG TPA: lipid A biosynthesis acyltransferase [Planctomycetaceae bacterium]|nr:lipid A biosynthesis acyltransferase [Planctomycetaceae bacterium]
MFRKSIDLVAYGVARCLIAVVQTMPLDMADSFCRVLAACLSMPGAIRRRTFDKNMELVFPESTGQQRQNLCRAMWHHLMLMICEIAWAQRRLHLVNWTKVLRIRNNRVMIKHLLAERPAVIVTGHFGNFEVGGYLVGLMGFPTVTIARRLDNEPLHRFVERFRGTHGQFMVDKEGCAPLIDRHLSRKGALSLLADQHAGDKGCWSRFLGVDASCHKALALFSLTSGAPMMVSATRRAGRPMYFEAACIAAVDPQDDPAGICSGVRTLTQWYNDQMAVAIGPAVEQYWWVHRRWRPKPARAAAQSAQGAAAKAA